MFTTCPEQMDCVRLSERTIEHTTSALLVTRLEINAVRCLSGRQLVHTCGVTWCLLVQILTLRSLRPRDPRQAASRQ